MELLPSKPILTVLLLYGGWPVRGGCVNSKQSSEELCHTNLPSEKNLIHPLISPTYFTP